ncbi:MAG: DNA repair protein RadA [Nitrospirota bacterium]|jgi:DNA repair protein RadA/Sms
MPKNKIIFACQVCGYQAPKWLGKCPDCGGWNTLVEERLSTTKIRGADIQKGKPIPILEIQSNEEDRILTHIGELDRVLGGGIVPGSVILIGGDPGIGKSTLLLQTLEGIRDNGKLLYVSGEESPNQIKLRGMRIGIRSNNLVILSETSLDSILETVDEIKPKVFVIDSIQTVFTSELPSAPGSIGQVRESAGRLMFYAKKTGIPIFLVGHVTKDGSIAGPRVLEHIVDTVLYFEGEKGHAFRILRAVKNRFGSTNEIGIFEMKDSGLSEVKNPSEIFLAERPFKVTGSVVVSSMEGTRPILVELQALVSSTNFGVPRRTTIGVDYNRVSLLLAILEKRVGMHLMGQDVFVNVVGGIKIDEPAVDLGIVTAVASSFREIPVDPKTFVFGEVGLAGEIRAINQVEARIKEGAKLGFKRVIIPINNAKKMSRVKDIEVIGVASVDETLEILFR